MKRSKVKARSSKSVSRPGSKAKARRARASTKAKTAKVARPKTKTKTKTTAKPKAKSKPFVRVTKATAKPRRKAAKTSKRARRDTEIPESQVTRARAKAAANGNGAPKRKKVRIVDVLQRDAPISRPLTAYESEALAVLASEFPADDPLEANTKIEERLRMKQLGEFDRERIEVLRSFKIELAEEIHRGQSSRYFTGSHGLYAAPEDFDHARLADDFAAKYPAISHEAVAAFIPIAVYCYYLR